jgi:hypothetical protein
VLNVQGAQCRREKRDRNPTCLPLCWPQAPCFTLAKERVSVGKHQVVYNDHFSLQTAATGKRASLALEKVGGHPCKHFTLSASQCATRAHVTEWKAEVVRR